MTTTNSDPELYAGFIEEVQGYLPQLHASIAAVNLDTRNEDALSEIHRLAHSIKGAAAMVGCLDLSQMAQWVEEATEKVVAGEQDWAGELPESMTDAINAIERMLLEPPSLGESDDDNAPSPYAEAGEETEGFSEDLPPEVMDAFKEESEEHILNISQELRALEQRPGNKQTLQSIRRSVHTLKGAAGMVGFKLVSKLAHRMEDLLDALYDGEISWTADVQPLLQSSFDTLEVMLRDPSTSRHSVLEGLYAAYAAKTAHKGEASSAPQPDLRMEAEADERMAELAERSDSGQGEDDSKQQFVRLPISVLDDLVKLVSELVVNRTDFEGNLARYRTSLGEIGQSVERLGKLSNKLDTDYEVLALQGQGNGSAGGGHSPLSTSAKSNVKGSEFDELEFDRYTEFHLLSRDLTETISDLGTASSQLDLLSGDFDHYLKRLGRLTTDVQDKLLRVRLVPLSQVLARLERTVKVTSQTAGKQVDLRVEGETVEFDKIILEDLIGPIEHILRNCVDHGVEDSPTRLAMGKSERGEVLMKAYHEGTQVVLQIRDNGRGIDPEKLRAAVVRLGFLSEVEAEELSTSDLFECVFQPGFTTAERISEISGRGVGMDVVKSTVLHWKGTVELDSVVGEGTLFTIRLPLTLASTKVMLVKAGGETYAVPLGLVSQSLQLAPTAIERKNQQEFINVDGESMMLHRLTDKLSLPGLVPAKDALVSVIVVRIGDKQMALSVDQLLDAREVVVKTLGGLLRRVKGVSGATMMGNGGVVLILDPASFFQQTLKGEPKKAAAAAVLEVPKAAGSSDLAPASADAGRRPWRVLIVDDSLSVRRVLTNFVKNNGWEPLSARDGQEAHELLEAAEQLPDAILLDVEMPRMNGYELLGVLRAKRRFQHLPVIMLTSRSSDKHRQKAFEAGANDYLVKPYNEKTLITTLTRVVTEKQPAAAAAK